MTNVREVDFLCWGFWECEDSSLTSVGRLGDLKQHRSRLQVSDFESRKVNVVDVVLGFAKIVWRDTKSTS